MAFIDEKDLKDLYRESKTEAHIWRSDYTAYERLANNDLMKGLDPNLPEVNDGSLSAALFKLPKRIVSKKLSGTVKALNRDEAWVSELANLQWQNEIIPNANTQAPFIRKWKDAVRKAAIYGSVPLITLSTEREDKTYTDFVVAQPQDVTLEPGKVSDYDSDVIFWDVYYTDTQWESMIEQAENEKKSNNEGSYNRWDIPGMKKIAAGDFKEERDPMDTPRQQSTKNSRPKGIKVCIAFQRGVNAPFYMYHKETNTTVREWSNPDPTGDIPVHFLYCYQDFINPYGIGIVKLAGGTQNVLDYMRQADILATQLGIRPPLQIQGNTDDVDIDSLVYAQDAQWFVGNAKVDRMELSNQVYSQLPARMSMYQTSLQKMIPMGDTSASSTDSGDPTQSKTPAGVKLQAANLSIDDEDFKDNLYITYEAVAKSMINTHFANMEGTDLMKLTDDERQLLIKAGLQFPADANGEMSNQLEVQWDTVRATFDFEVDPEQDKAKDDADRLEGLTKVAELMASDPTLDQDLMSAGKKLNKGELFSEIIQLTSNNDKIITDISPDEKAAQQEQAAQAPADASKQPKMPSESLNYKDAPEDIKRQIEAQAGLTPSQMTSPGQQQLDQAAQAQGHGQAMDLVNAATPGQSQQPQPATTNQPAAAQPNQQEIQANVDAVMKQYGVDETTALTALAAEAQGFPPEDVIAHLQKVSQQGVAA